MSSYKRNMFRDGYGLRGWVIVVNLFAIGVVLFVGLMAIIHVSSSVQCRVTGEQLNRSTNYEFWGSGCYIQIEDGTYVPEDQWRFTELDKET